MHEPFDRTEDPDNLAINPDPCYCKHTYREKKLLFFYIEYNILEFCFENNVGKNSI